MAFLLAAAMRRTIKPIGATKPTENGPFTGHSLHEAKPSGMLASTVFCSDNQHSSLVQARDRRRQKLNGLGRGSDAWSVIVKGLICRALHGPDTRHTSIRSRRRKPDLLQGCRDTMNLHGRQFSKLVQDLEAHLGTKLVERTTRSVTMTCGRYCLSPARPCACLRIWTTWTAPSLAPQRQGRLRIDIGSVLANRILIRPLGLPAPVSADRPASRRQ